MRVSFGSRCGRIGRAASRGNARARVLLRLIRHRPEGAKVARRWRWARSIDGCRNSASRCRRGGAGRELRALRAHRATSSSSRARSASGRTARSPTPTRASSGREVSLEAGQEAARLCAINVLAQMRAAIGDLEGIVRCVRLGGFINAEPSFAALRAGDERRLRPDGRGARRPRPARPLDHRRRRAAARRRGRGRGDVRGPMNAPDWLVARPIAHRGLHDRRRRPRREHARRRRGRDRRRLRDRMRRAGHGRRRGRRVPRLHARPAHRRDRAGAGAHGRRARRDRPRAARRDRIPTLAAFLGRIAGRDAARRSRSRAGSTTTRG